MLPDIRRALLAVLATCATVLALVVPVGPPVRAATPEATAVAAAEDDYIVVMKDHVTTHRARSARATAIRNGGRVTHDYGTALRGFAASLSDSAVQKLRSDRAVAYVERDRPIRVDAEQSGATWGLDRVDQRRPPLNGTYNYTRTGVGVRAYVIDTGIRAAHDQFGDRVTSGFTTVLDGRGSQDCNGHGTHVAGTLGGQRYGVAKRVRLTPVRVLDCDGTGSTSGVIAGIDWVTAHHGSRPAVANMSLGGGPSNAIDDAVARSISDGITYAVAAGNAAEDACNHSPARQSRALTVAATGRRDGRASYSNYGSCVDLFAPGNDITSAWATSDTSINSISGTSMATPHVTGTAALYLEGAPEATPGKVGWAIRSTATSGVVRYTEGSPNLLLYSRLRR